MVKYSLRLLIRSILMTRKEREKAADIKKILAADIASKLLFSNLNSDKKINSNKIDGLAVNLSSEPGWRYYLVEILGRSHPDSLVSELTIDEMFERIKKAPAARIIDLNDLKYIYTSYNDENNLANRVLSWHNNPETIRRNLIEIRKIREKIEFEQQKQKKEIEDWELWSNASSSRVQIEDSLLNWIQKQDSDTWHSILRGWNYDNDGEIIKWIISQENCDLGTALSLQFRNAINFMTEEPKSLRAHRKIYWEIYQKIAENVSHGFYKNSNFILFTYHDEVVSFQKYIDQFYEEHGSSHPFTLPKETYEYKGKNDPKSDYTAIDGEIMYSYEKWKNFNI